MADQIEVPEVVDTFVKGSFNTTSYYKLIACFAGEVSDLEDMADGAVAEAIAMGQTRIFRRGLVACFRCLAFLSSRSCPRPARAPWFANDNDKNTWTPLPTT